MTKINDFKNNFYEPEFVSKSIFFPKQGILAIGDLHLGYDDMLRELGILVPTDQLKELKQEIKKIIDILNKRGRKIKRIIFLGDITHAFGFKWTEKDHYKEIIKFSKKFVPEKNIVIIKGNHDTIDYSYQGKFTEIFIEEGIAFVHGHKEMPGLFDKKVSTIVMGHLHPSITLRDSQKIRMEKYKAFLIGKANKKQTFVLPSFLNIVEGVNIRDYAEDYNEYFSIIKRKDLLNFQVKAIGENRIYEFGTVKKLPN